MRIWLNAVVVVGMTCLLWACRPYNVLVITINKQPFERVESGSVLIKRWKISGAADYQWIYVPDEKSKALITGILKGVNLSTDRHDIAGVKTVDEYIAGLSGNAQEKENQEKEIKADMAGHAVVIHSYMNKTKHE